MQDGEGVYRLCWSTQRRWQVNRKSVERAKGSIRDRCQTKRKEEEERGERWGGGWIYRVRQESLFYDDVLNNSIGVAYAEHCSDRKRDSPPLQDEIESLFIEVSYAVSCPYTVVIHAEDAATTFRAVVRSFGFEDLALHTVSFITYFAVAQSNHWLVVLFYLLEEDMSWIEIRLYTYSERHIAWIRYDSTAKAPEEHEKTERSRINVRLISLRVWIIGGRKSQSTTNGGKRWWLADW